MSANKGKIMHQNIIVETTKVLVLRVRFQKGAIWGLESVTTDCKALLAKIGQRRERLLPQA